MAIEPWVPEIGFWWTGVFFVLLFVPLMIFVGKKLSEEHRNYMLYGMGIYQLGVKFANQISPILSDSYILATHLPLQLCSISGILAGVVVFYRKQILLEFLYFFLMFCQLRCCRWFFSWSPGQSGNRIRNRTILHYSIRDFRK